MRNKPKLAASSRKKPRPPSPAYHHGDLRAAMLRAAAEMIEEGGVENFTLRAGARHAGVSHSAPAHHFRNKTGLLADLAMFSARERYAKTEEMLESAGRDPLNRLEALGVAYIEYAIRHPQLHKLMFTDRNPLASGTRRNDDIDKLGQIFVAGVEEAIGKRLEPVASNPETILPWALVHGFAALVNEGLVLHDVPAEKKADLALDLATKVLHLLRPLFQLMRTSEG